MIGARLRARGRICALLVLVGIGTVHASAHAELVLRRLSTGDLQTVDPQLWVYGQDGNVVQDLFQGLTTVDAAARTVPGQAESWTVSPDGRTYTFKLRPNLAWSDGVPITSADFVYSFRRLFAPATASASASLLYVVKNAREVAQGRMPPEAIGVRAPDARTVVVVLEHPAPYFTEIAVHRAMPVPRHVVEKFGREWTRPGNIVTNGPFTFAEWRPGAYVKLLRNPRFHAASTVKLDAVYHIPIEDPKIALLRYRAGELDLVMSLPSEQIDELRREYGPQLHLTRQIGLEYLAFNVRSGPTRDARVRRALSMAIDRALLSARVLRAGEPVTHCIVPPDIPGHPQTDCADYSTWTQARRMAEARRLLAEAGYDATRPLVLRYRLNNTDTQRRIGLAVSAMWQPLGVRLELIGADMKSHQQAVLQGDFDVARGAWYAEDRDAMSYLALVDGRGSGVNVSGYANPEVDRLLSEADGTADAPRRMSLMTRAELTAVRDQPIAPLYVYVSRKLVSPRIAGWVDNVRGVNVSRYLSLRDVSTSSTSSPAAPRNNPARRPE